MIYVSPDNRRADTMTIVSEGLAFRHYVTGEFKLVAKACGYLDLVLKNLAEFFEAGVIEPSPRPEDRGDGINWDGLRWTKTGHYLWKQWKEGPPRAVVELPKSVSNDSLPGKARDWLIELGGLTIDYVWHPRADWVVGCTRDNGDNGVMTPVVYLFSPGGRFLASFHGRADAVEYAASIIAAAR